MIESTQNILIKKMADGILSTESGLVQYAKSKGFLTVQRFLCWILLRCLMSKKQFPLDYADAVKILPGIMPKIIRRIAGLTDKPVIAGGRADNEQKVLIQ